MANYLDSISAELAAREQDALTEQQLEQARAAGEQAARIVDEHAETARQIRGNREYSKHGIETKLGALAMETQNRLHQVLGQRIEDLDRRLADEEMRLTPQPPDGDAMMEFLKQQEARAMLKEQYRDPLELQAEYTAWGPEGGHDLQMRAVENAPVPMIADPAVLERGKRARASRQQPQTARLLGQLRRQRAMLSTTLQTAQAELGLPKDDPIRRIASGGMA